MKSKSLVFFLWIALLPLLSLPPVESALAQTSAWTISDTLLTQLHTALIARPDDTYVQDRIEQEKLRIRKEIEDELKAKIEAIANAEPADGETVPSALEKEREIIAALEKDISSWKVDRDLLDAEEKRYYETESPEPTPEDPTKLTESHPQLLARRAILELRIETGNSMLDLEKERLKKLINEQRFAQFDALINIGKYALIILVIILIERIVRNIFLSRIRHNTRRYVVTKIFSAFIYIVAGLWFFSILFAEHPGIITSFAIIGAGIAVALQDVVKDLMGWVIILQGGLFTRGDRITIGQYTGEVVDFTMLRTTLLEVNPADSSYDALERTGKTMFLPNSRVLTERVLNYHTTSDYTKAEMNVVVTLETDWRKAKEILRNIVAEETKAFIERDRQQHTHRTRHFYVPHEPGDSKMYMDIGANGIVFTLRITIPIGERREVLSHISERILEAFETENIELAYTTVRSFAMKTKD